MNLILDFGNSYKKLAFFDNNKIIELKIFKNLTLDNLINFTKNKTQIKSAIISSVVEYPKSIKKHLVDNYNFIELNKNTSLPIINKYKTPETLGPDRIAAVVGANNLYPGKDILVIDAGTCITYDFINSDNEYLVGSISPGIKLRFNALYNFTDKLPLINETINNDITIIDDTTKRSIVSSVINGVILEIDGIINQYKKNILI